MSMSDRYPRPTYGLGILPYALRGVESLFEVVEPHTAWWHTYVQPILEPFLWPVAPAFLLGLVLQDGFDRESWLRYWWRRLAAKFVLVSLSVSQAEEPKRIQVTALIRFTKNISLGQLVLRVHSCMNAANGGFLHVIRVDESLRALKGEQRQIEIAKVPIAYPGWTPIHSAWGPGWPGHSRAVAGLSKNVVDIEVIGGWLPQRHRIFVSNLGYGTQTPVPIVYAQDQDEDVFAVMKIT